MTPISGAFARGSGFPSSPHPQPLPKAPGRHRHPPAKAPPPRLPGAPRARSSAPAPGPSPRGAGAELGGAGAPPPPPPVLTASSVLLVPLGPAALAAAEAAPERVQMRRWLLSEGGSKEMNSELESMRSKGGRRRRQSRAAGPAGRAVPLRRTTMAERWRPAPAPRAILPPRPARLRLPSRPALPPYPSACTALLLPAPPEGRSGSPAAAAPPPPPHCSPSRRLAARGSAPPRSPRGRLFPRQLVPAPAAEDHVPRCARAAVLSIFWARKSWSRLFRPRRALRPPLRRFRSAGGGAAA